VVFLPDGKTLISCSWDGLRFWDTATGRGTRTLQLVTDVGSAEGGSNFAFSADRKVVAFVGNDGRIRLRGVDTDKELQVLDKKHDDYPRHVLALSPDGKTLASAQYQRQSRVTVWDVATGRQLWSADGAAGLFRVLAFSRDGKLLAEGGRDQIRLWDVATGKPRRSWQVFALGLSLSPDGKTLAALIRHDGDRDTLRLWDVTSGKESDAWRKRELGASLFTFSADGKTLLTARVSGGPIGVRCWDVSSTREVPLRTFQAGTPPDSRAALSPDGKLLAWGTERVVRLWDTTTGKEIVKDADERSAVKQVVFAPDGKTLLTVSEEHTVRQWDLAKGTAVGAWQAPKSAISTLALSRNGKTAVRVGGNEQLLLLDGAAGKKIDQQKTAHFLKLNAEMVLSPDGKTLAASGWAPDRNEHTGSTAFIKHLSSGKEISLWTTSGRLFVDHWAFFFSPDSSILAGVHNGSRIRLWDVATHKEIRSFEGAGQHLEFAPDNKLLAVSGDGKVRLLEMATGQFVQSFDLQVAGASVVFSPDGRLLVVGDRNDVVIRDVATGKKLHAWKGHLAEVRDVAFSPDGKTVASASADTTVLLWNAAAVHAQVSAPASATDRELDQLWQALADNDAAKAHQALGVLVAAPRLSVPFVRKHVPPAPDSLKKAIARWLDDLDSDDFAVRKQAAQELEKQGRTVLPSLQQALRNRPSVEKAARLQQLLAQAERGYSSDELRVLRAIAVLERIGTSEARAVLEAVASGVKEAWLTQEAERALKRLARRSS
jgi:WD40 repeat protein